MKTIKTVLLAGALATVSTMAFSQTVAPTSGVNYDSLYTASATIDGNVSYAQAPHYRTSTVNHAAAQQRGRAVTSGSGVGSPD